MIIQDYLQSNTIASLVDVGIEYNLYPYNDKTLLQLNYNQIFGGYSPMMSECRALILSANGILTEKDVPGTTEIVCRSFDRFLNLGQNGAVIDFNKRITLFEKLDGSLINVYFFDGQWRTSTRSVWDGSNCLTKQGCEEVLSFRKLFEKSLPFSFEYLTSKLDPDYTYMFELTTPVNRVVVIYEEFKTWLIGCRHTKTGKEVDVRTLDIGISLPRIYDFNTINDIQSFLSEVKDFNFEGFVSVDEDFKRVKIKSEKYLVAHRVASNVSTDIHLAEIVLNKMDDDLQAYLSEYQKKRIDDLKAGFASYCQKSDAVFERYKHLPRKEFALSISKEGLPTAPLFVMFTGKSKSTMDYFLSSKKNGVFSRPALECVIEQSLGGK